MTGGPSGSGSAWWSWPSCSCRAAAASSGSRWRRRNGRTGLRPGAAVRACAAVPGAVRACGRCCSASPSMRSASALRASCRPSPLVFAVSLVLYTLGQWDQAAHYNLEPPLVALVLGLLVVQHRRRPRVGRSRAARGAVCQDRHRTAGRRLAPDSDRLGGPGGDRAGGDRLAGDLRRDLFRRHAPGPRSPAGGNAGHRRRGMRGLGRHRDCGRGGRDARSTSRSRSRWSSSGPSSRFRAAAGGARPAACPRAWPAPGSAPPSSPMPPGLQRPRPTAVMRGTSRASSARPEAAVNAFTLMKVIGRDVWIGVWAFVLSIVATTRWENTGVTGRARVGEIWRRFPKFVLGFLLASAIVTLVASGYELCGVQEGGACRSWSPAAGAAYLGLHLYFPEHRPHHALEGVRQRRAPGRSMPSPPALRSTSCSAMSCRRRYSAISGLVSANEPSPEFREHGDGPLCHGAGLRVLCQLSRLGCGA